MSTFTRVHVVRMRPHLGVQGACGDLKWLLADHCGQSTYPALCTAGVCYTSVAFFWGLYSLSPQQG